MTDLEEGEQQPSDTYQCATKSDQGEGGIRPTVECRYYWQKKDGETGHAMYHCQDDDGEFILKMKQAGEKD